MDAEGMRCQLFKHCRTSTYLTFHDQPWWAWMMLRFQTRIQKLVLHRTDGNFYRNQWTHEQSALGQVIPSATIKSTTNRRLRAQVKLKTCRKQTKPQVEDGNLSSTNKSGVSRWISFFEATEVEWRWTVIFEDRIDRESLKIVDSYDEVDWSHSTHTDYTHRQLNINHQDWKRRVEEEKMREILKLSEEFKPCWWMA